MADKSNKKERVINFIDRGYSNREIASFMPDVSESYIRRIRRDLGYSTKKISSEKYYKAVINNTGTKDDLAAKLGMCKSSLCYFERDSDLKKQVAQYLRATGMGLHSIAEKMGTSIAILKEMGIDRVPDVYTVKNQIETLTRIFEVIAQWNAEAATLFYQWQKVLDRLK